MTITLDDLLVEEGHIAPFLQSGPNYTAMGRFGNVLLINGETAFAGNAAQGEVVRLNLVNTANTRIFNFAVPGARMKLVGGDSGRYEQRPLLTRYYSHPRSERLSTCCSIPPVRCAWSTALLTMSMTWAPLWSPEPNRCCRGSFDVLRPTRQLLAERERIALDTMRAPDKSLAFVGIMPLLYGADSAPASLYSCPMHPDVTSRDA